MLFRSLSLRCVAPLLGLLFLAPPSFAAESAAPRVIASIAPVQSLAAALMDGIAPVQQLVPAGMSPHTYALKPSDASRLAQADVIFWVGPALEGFLPRILASVPRQAQIVELAEVAGVDHLPLRQGGPWGEHHHDEPADHKDDHADHKGHADHVDHADHEEGGEDQHLWLNPQNARAWVAAMTQALSQADPSHAAHYEERARQLDQSLIALDQDLKDSLAPVQRVPFLVFHDAYQHMEKRYGLTAVGALSIDPSQSMGARRLGELREHIQKTNARCLFAEPQFSDRLPTVVTEHSSTKLGVLDPLGQPFAPGPDQYFQTMRALAASFKSCLSQSKAQ